MKLLTELKNPLKSKNTQDKNIYYFGFSYSVIRKRNLGNEKTG